MMYDARSEAGPDRPGRLLAAMTALAVPVALACAIGLAADRRQLLGEGVWVKPLKFAVSIGLAGAAALWLRRRMPRTRDADRAVVGITLALVVEQVLISVQAARGVRSHFNQTTPLDGAVYGLMGLFVSVAFVGLVVLARLAVRTSTGDRVTDTVARWGSWLVVGGASVGLALVANDGHTVGGADGGPGLPLVGWSTAHGDLRPGHFVGLHGLQLLIVLAALARRRRLDDERLVRLVRPVGAAVAALTVALTLQALARQPLTSVSSLAVAAVTAIAVWRTWHRTQASGGADRSRTDPAMAEAA